MKIKNSMLVGIMVLMSCQAHALKRHVMKIQQENKQFKNHALLTRAMIDPESNVMVDDPGMQYSVAGIIAASFGNTGQGSNEVSGMQSAMIGDHWFFSHQQTQPLNQGAQTSHQQTGNAWSALKPGHHFAHQR